MSKSVSLLATALVVAGMSAPASAGSCCSPCYSMRGAWNYSPGLAPAAPSKGEAPPADVAPTPEQIEAQKQQPQTTQRFSFEPGAAPAPAPAAEVAPIQQPAPQYRSYSMRSSRTPSFLLPKSDSRKFRGR